MFTEVALNVAAGSDRQVYPAYLVVGFIAKAGVLVHDIGYYKRAIQFHYVLPLRQFLFWLILGLIFISSNARGARRPVKAGVNFLSPVKYAEYTDGHPKTDGQPTINHPAIATP